MKVRETLRDPRRRVILITIIAAAILLVLLVALVVNSINGRQKNTAAHEKSDIAVSSPVEDSRLEPVKNSSESVAVVKPSTKPANTATNTSNTASATSTAELPATGPESILPLALIAGAATSFALSRKSAYKKSVL